jgi:hypothetical protein
MQAMPVQPPRRTWIRRTLILTLALLLGLAFSLGVTAFAEAGVADWFSSSNQQPAQKPRTVKKAGLKTQASKKKSPTSKMLGQLTSGPKNLVSSTKALFTPDKPASHSVSRGVPRKMVADKPAQPSMLQRLFTPPQPQPARTVSEWIAQERPK